MPRPEVKFELIPIDMVRISDSAEFGIDGPNFSASICVNFCRNSFSKDSSDDCSVDFGVFTLLSTFCLHFDNFSSSKNFFGWFSATGSESRSWFNWNNCSDPIVRVFSSSSIVFRLWRGRRPFIARYRSREALSMFEYFPFITISWSVKKN